MEKDKKEMEMVLSFPNKEIAEEGLFYLMALSFEKTTLENSISKYKKVLEERENHKNFEELNAELKKIIERESFDAGEKKYAPAYFNEANAIFREGIDSIELSSAANGDRVSVIISFYIKEALENMSKCIDALGLSKELHVSIELLNEMRMEYLNRLWRYKKLSQRSDWGPNIGKRALKKILEHTREILMNSWIERPCALDKFNHWSCLNELLENNASRFDIMEIEMSIFGRNEESIKWFYSHMEWEALNQEVKERLEFGKRAKRALEKYPDNQILGVLYAMSQGAKENASDELLAYKKALGDLSNCRLLSQCYTPLMRYLNLLGRCGNEKYAKQAFENMVKNETFNGYCIVNEMTRSCMAYLEDWDLAARLAMKLIPNIKESVYRGDDLSEYQEYHYEDITVNEINSFNSQYNDEVIAFLGCTIDEIPDRSIRDHYDSLIRDRLNKIDIA